MPQDSETQSSPQFADSRVALALQGLVGALLCWFAARDLGLLDLFPIWRGATATIFVAAAVGAGLGLTRARALIGVGATFLLGLWLVVAFTPLSAICARSLVVAQPAAQADAVVVLLASIQRDDDFGTPSLERTLHGLALMRQNHAPRLILTQGFPPQGSHRVAVSRLMENLKMPVPLQIVGPVRDTHDEALLVSDLARRNGWKRILLVTSQLHSRRASLVFAKTGLNVVSTPCRETSFDLENLNSPGGRIKAFNSAIHEIIGLRVYRARGWI
jgi:uncharacterized SAM-binding protein YcdF (DUF218 family)